MATVVVADDHEIVRRGMRSVLEAEPDLQIVAEANDGVNAARLVERLQPDVLVLDLMMPDINGIEVARQARRRSPRTKIVVVSMQGDERYVAEAVAAGAHAYVLKEAGAAEVVTAVRTVLGSRTYFSPPLSEPSIMAYLERTQGGRIDPLDTLTTREREVFYLVAQGFTNAEIGERLSISHRTAETHRARVMHKLAFDNHADLIRYAVQRGLLPSPE